MTWLGKILTFVVMIAAVVWMYLNVQAYVSRTNWKTSYDKLKIEYDKSVAAQATELNRNKTSEDAYKRLYLNEQARAEGLLKQVDSISTANKKIENDFKVLQDGIMKGDVNATVLQTNVDVTLKELDTVRARNTVLEDNTSQLVIKAEEAKRDMVRAQNEAKLARSIADDFAKRNDELQAQIFDIKNGGTDLKRLMQNRPPPVLSNLRGEIVRVQGDLVQLSIGVDAGLSKGTVLDLSRLDGEGRYLGSVRITDVFNKESVGVFTPARSNIPFAQLRPEELPKKGDQVKPQESIISR
jgi:chromosome segregation ATPase